MIELRYITKVIIILINSVFSIPALSQPPSVGVRSEQNQIVSPLVRTLLDAGNKAMNASPAQFDEAEKQYKAALIESRKLADSVGESLALLNIGTVYATRKQAEEAMTYFQQSLVVSRAGSDKKMQALALQDMAILYSSGQLEKSLDFIRQAIALFPEARKTAIEVGILTLLGNRLEGQSQFSQAIKVYNEAIPLSISIHDDRAEADVTWYLARAWTRLETSDKDARMNARNYFQKAVAIYHRINDSYDEAWTYQNLGDLSRLEASSDEARAYYLKAISLYRKLTNQTYVASALRQLSNLESNSGRYVEALNYDQEALTIYEKIGNKKLQALQMMNVALLYRVVGQAETAFNYDMKALALFDQTDDIYNRITALMQIETHYWILGDFKRAQIYMDRLMPLLQKPASGLDKIRVISILGDIYFQKKDYTKAKESLELLLNLQNAAGFSTTATIGQLGSIEKELGHSKKALEYFRRELNLLTNSENNHAKSRLIVDIALIEQDQGNFETAEKLFDEAIDLNEKVRASFGGLNEAKSSFLNSKLLVYQSYLFQLITKYKSSKAFTLAQKMKARTLLDILDEGKIHLVGSLSQAELEQEKYLRKKSDSLNYKLVNEGVQNEIGSKKRAEKIKLQLVESERELLAFEEKVYAVHPELANKRAAKTITLEDVPKFLPEDTALFEYVTLKTDGIDETLLFLVTQKAGIPNLSTYIIPIKQASLIKQIDSLRDACADPRKPYRAVAQALYKTLISPAQSRIAGKKRLLICPDGVLWDVPFATLLTGMRASSKMKNPGLQFLIQQYEIAYAYSATGAQAELMSQVNSKRRKPTKTMLAFADPYFGGELRFGDHQPGERPLHDASRRPSEASRPLHDASRRPGEASRPLHDASRPIPDASRDPLQLMRGGFLSQLPGTLQEAYSIKADFKDAVIYTKQAAQEAKVKKQAGDYRFLHFATHGFFNDAAPLLSAIVLAQPDAKSEEDGFLTAREIFDLDLSADMVVLSACNTARGEKRNGEGLIGLTWALFAAGAPTQVVSQWSVNDASTALLMREFYSNLTRGHMEKGAALRQASLSLLNGNRQSTVGNRKYAHPYYWAPFILIGNWGK